MSLEETIREFRELKKESSNKEKAKIIRRIGEKGEISYQIIMMLVKEELERGYSKKYSLTTLLERIPWEKSRAIEKLREIETEGILKHEKKKYYLNRENKLVKRIWKYYNEPSYWRRKEVEEINQLIKKKRELMQEIENREREMKRNYQEMNEREERELGREIKEEIREGSTKEELVEYIEKNIERVLGVVKRRKE